MVDPIEQDIYSASGNSDKPPYAKPVKITCLKVYEKGELSKGRKKDNNLMEHYFEVMHQR